MRFPVLLVAGLVCIALGVGLSEWSRRHPPAKVEPVVAPPPAPVTAEELVASEALPGETLDEEALGNATAALKEQSAGAALPDEVTTAGAEAVLKESLLARSAVTHANSLFLVVEESKQGAQQTLVRFSADAPPAVIAVHRIGVSALAAFETKLFWAEGGSLFAAEPAGPPPHRLEGLRRFPKARVTSLAVHGKTLIATLVPKDLDLFSTDPVGAVVAVSLDSGAVTVLATKQIRPSDAATDGEAALWISGYPSDLLSANLLTKEVKTRIQRADGPVLAEDHTVVFKHPETGAPELQWAQTTGEGADTLAHGEVERVTRFGEDVWFSVGGTISVVTKGKEPHAVATLPGPVLELGVTDDALYALYRQDNGGRQLLRLPRTTPEGNR